MSLTRKRYRWIRLLMIIVLGIGLLLGKTNVVSYSFGTPMQDMLTREPLEGIEKMRIPKRRTGHPRENLFEKPLEK